MLKLKCWIMILLYGGGQKHYSPVYFLYKYKLNSCFRILITVYWILYSLYLLYYYSKLFFSSIDLFNCSIKWNRYLVPTIIIVQVDKKSYLYIIYHIDILYVFRHALVSRQQVLLNCLYCLVHAVYF